MKSFRPALAASMILALAAPVASAPNGIIADGASTKIGITGFVPVICRAQLSAANVPVQPGVVRLGELREFCNSPRGYRVHADYSASLVHAKLLVDGMPVPLQPDGTVIVSRSNRAAIDVRAIDLELPKKAQGGAISFRIEPL